MHERALRTVLLIQAIEQSDRTGELLPLADRAEATRAAARDDARLREAMANETLTGGTLSSRTEGFLVRRAERLRERVEHRSPVIHQLLTLAGGSSWLGRALCVIAFFVGVGLSALDGSRRINILAFPLVGLILWNLVVYILLLGDRLRTKVRTAPASHGTVLTSFYDRWIRSRADALLRRSSQFNAPLADALKRFASDWSVIAQPLLVLRAKRLFHGCAALVAVGLIAGIYVRGIALRYEAGWESTFLGPVQVGALLKVLYGPASLLSGIPLPASSDAINSLRWSGGVEQGGGEAAMWIHLLALTAVLYIVMPRLFAAVLATFSLWWTASRVPAPVGLLPYLRETLSEAGDTVRHVVGVTSFAYEPDAAAAQGLERLLSASLGGTVMVDMRAPVRYGDEESLSTKAARDADRVASLNVLLMSLASTPEAENHGAVVASARDALIKSRSPAPMLIVVDEGPYVARMGTDPSMQARIEERRRLWRDFVAGYGVRACLIDLSRLAREEALGLRDTDALRGALWTARERAVAS